MVYKALDGLVVRELVEKHDEKGSVALFSPVHPGKLRELLAIREESIFEARTQLEAQLGAFSSKFNLFSGKPNVRFFEGKKGMEEVLDDSLYAKEEIMTFADLEAIMKYIPDVNENYVKKREKLGIKKRGILFDTPENRSMSDKYHVSVTDLRLMPWDGKSTGTIVQIYDNKVSFLTLKPESMVGIIIEDPHVYTMQKEIFEFVWKTLEPKKITQ
jgi:sugar-specific transcriptional regulator TrmB